MAPRHRDRITGSLSVEMPDLPAGDRLAWDYQHGEVEMYDKSGRNHLGAFDAATGRKIKDGVPSRKVEK